MVYFCMVEAVEVPSMDEPFEVALEFAKAQLAALDREAEELDRKRARARQAILVLRPFLGIKQVRGEGLTGAILDDVKGADRFLTAAQVAERLNVSGFEVKTTTVATILSRLHKAGKLKKDAEISGYAWAGIAKDEEEPGG